MTVKLIKNQLNEFILDNIRSSSRMIKSRYPNLYEYINVNFEGNSFKEKCYVAIFGRNNICPISKKPTKFIDYKIGYQKYFSNKEAAVGEKENRLERMKKAFIDKYGVEHYSKTEQFKNTIKKKHEEGEYDYEEIQIKSKKTRLERYENEKYINYDKIKDTKLKKYSNPHYNNRERAIKTTIERYGVDNVNKLPKNRNKLGKFKIKQKVDRILDFCKLNNIEILSKIDNCTKNLIDGNWIRTKYEFRCNKCNNKYESYLSDGEYPICNYCNPTISSKPEQELKEFLSSIYKGEILYNVRDLISPYEIDIVIPEYKLGIEMNGVYFHSEVSGNKDANYHIDKTNMMKEKGYELIHIFDNEWNYKKDIVKSILRNRLNANINKIYARNTHISKLNVEETRVFLNANHLQGEDNSSIRYGLYYKGELISIMTFGRNRYGKDAEYEIYRFCNKLNYNVIGGGDKLFKYFIKTHSPKSIKTFSDIRYFNGNVYTKLGFKFEKFTQPNYFYTKNYKQLYNRQKFQKHKLQNVLREYDSKKTEFQNMIDNGYDRIWDCGNVKLMWNKNTPQT